MPLDLSFCTEADAPAIVRLSAAAFSTPTPSNVFPDTPAVNAFRLRRFVHSINHDPFAVFVKIVDDEVPEEERLVAMGKWTRPYTPEEKMASEFVDLVRSDELPKECNREVIRAMGEKMGDLKREIMGDRPCYYLNVLATHPDHGGRGCAGRLIKWGMQKAEEEGVECYVEAQDSSRPIFVKYGWEEVKALVVKEVRRGTVLTWSPKKKDISSKAGR